MEKPTVVVGGSVSGNIGSCEIKTTDINLSTVYKQTVAVNSCNGKVISKSEPYVGLETVFLGLIISVIALGLFLGALLTMIFGDR